MDENERKTTDSTNTNVECQKDKNPVFSKWFGYLFGGYSLICAVMTILWVVWLFQGKPDTWYGRIFRFEQTVDLLVLAILAAGIALILIGAGIYTLVMLIQSKKCSAETDKYKKI